MNKSFVHLVCLILERILSTSQKPNKKQRKMTGAILHLITRLDLCTLIIIVQLDVEAKDAFHLSYHIMRFRVSKTEKKCNLYNE